MRSVYSVARERNETYCLVEEADGWHVIYSERGNRNSERVFMSKAAASDELVRLVTNDGAIQPLTQNDKARVANDQASDALMRTTLRATSSARGRGVGSALNSQPGDRPDDRH